MVQVRVRKQDCLHVSDLEAQLPDVHGNLLRRIGKSTVDQHMAEIRRDQDGGDVLHAYVVGVAVDPERLHRLVPAGAFGTVRYGAGGCAGSAGGGQHGEWQRREQKRADAHRQCLIGMGPDVSIDREAYRRFPSQDQAVKRRALRNSRIQPLNSPAAGGCQEFCATRQERSGWGMVSSTRPSVLVTAAMPSGEPLGLAG
jgi:hypothetical protein